MDWKMDNKIVVRSHLWTLHLLMNKYWMPNCTFYCHICKAGHLMSRSESMILIYSTRSTSLCVFLNVLRNWTPYGEKNTKWCLTNDVMSSCYLKNIQCNDSMPHHFTPKIIQNIFTEFTQKNISKLRMKSFCLPYH